MVTLNWSRVWAVVAIIYVFLLYVGLAVRAEYRTAGGRG